MLVKITDGGMRNGCYGVVIGKHSDLEFIVQFEDRRISYFLDSEFVKIN